jgi:hypothetical protein
MKQILSPFQKFECFEAKGDQFLVLDYTIIQDNEHKLVEWCSVMSIKRLKDHKHYMLPMTQILEKYKTKQLKPIKCK